MRLTCFLPCVVLSLLPLVWGGGSLAAPASVPAISSFHLKNGMEVVLIENHRIPAISHVIAYRVGGADDPPGRSGLAHYNEHMMFQGTPAHPKGVYNRMIDSLGGNHNAFTSTDYTAYYVTAPKANLGKVMELEADRMRSLAPTKEDFAREREVIIEERRQVVDGKPRALLGEQMHAALFLNHPYRTPIIGWKHEMEGLSRDDVLAFHTHYYYPANAMLVVAGDLTPDALKVLAEKYYGGLPSGPPPNPRAWRAEPPAIAARRLTLQHENVKEPLWVRKYQAPALTPAKDNPAIAIYVLSQILGGGETGRLYQSLVARQKLATHVDIDYDGLNAGPGIFTLSVTPAQHVPLDALEKAIEAELAALQTAPPTGEELARAKTLLKAETLYAREGLQSMAFLFTQLRMIGLPAELFNQWPDLIDQVTAKQVQEAEKSVFNANNSVTGILLPSNQSLTEKKQAVK